MTVHNYICIIYIPDIHVSMCANTHTHTLWQIQEPELSLHILHTFYLFISDIDYK